MAVDQAAKGHRTRTNLVLDDELVDEARRLSGIATKREVVEEALRVFVRLKHQERVLELFGKVKWDGDSRASV